MATPARQAIVDACIAEPRSPGRGSVYEVSIFHAERHVTQSNFTLTLDGFVTEQFRVQRHSAATRFAPASSSATTAPSRTRASTGTATIPARTLGPHCGDGVVQDACTRTATTGRTSAASNGCNPDCTQRPVLRRRHPPARARRVLRRRRTERRIRLRLQRTPARSSSSSPSVASTSMISIGGLLERQRDARHPLGHESSDGVARRGADLVVGRVSKHGDHEGRFSASAKCIVLGNAAEPCA